MQSYESILPLLELNLKKDNKEEPQIHRRSRNLRNILISPLYRISKIKAYSYFDSIKQKELKNKEILSKNTPKNLTANKYKLLSNDNHNTKIKENSNKKNSVIIPQLLNKIKERFPSHIHYFSYKTPEVDKHFSDKMKKINSPNFKSLFNESLKFKTKLIEQKEKEKLYKKNIDKKYNININRIKSYTRNKKLFINGLRKNPKYFNNYRSFIKSLKKKVPDSLDNLSLSNSYLNISSIRNINSKVKKLSKNKDNSVNNIKNENNKRYKIIKIKRLDQPLVNDFLKKVLDD